MDLKNYKTYKDVLSMAHKRGLESLVTQILQYPDKENGGHCIVQATAQFKDIEGKWSDIGDAMPGNVNKMIAPHLVRMASTRAKGRTLRDAMNFGDPIAEELDV